MCSLIMLRRPEDEAWPLIIAANRDENRSRPAAPPARHWPDRPDVVAGLDAEAGGSWLGLNDESVVAAILNRRGTLGREAGRRSRGELVLEALDHAEARAAARALAHLEPLAYRPFNLVVADRVHAFWIRHDGERIEARPIGEGLSMLTAGEIDDPSSPRIRRYRPLFRAADPPRPEAGDWSGWQLLLGTRKTDTGDPRDALCIVTDGDYGTVSSSLLALPAEATRKPVWLHADGPPDRTPFAPVPLA